MADVEMRECPFCGAAPQLVIYAEALSYKVECQTENCPASPGVYTHRKQAIADWNRRRMSDSLRAEMLALHASMKRFRRALVNIRGAMHAKPERLREIAAQTLELDRKKRKALEGKR